jgi:hypothetical protein
MPALLPISLGPLIGPKFIPKKKKRDHYAHELAETVSLTDRVFQDTSMTVHFDFIDYKFSNPFVVKAVPQAEAIIEEYREMIREHVERRILFFFQQLIVCYQTKLHFESNGAKDQGKSANRILLNVNGKEKVLSSRQAAHSSTLPCLIAYDNAAWKNHRAGGSMPQGFVFLKGTDYYRTANATMNMPKWMNDADREIDEKTKNSLLRDKSLAIVNRASQGQVSPNAGILEFLEEALKEIKAGKKRLQDQNKGLEVQKILSLYEEYFTEFQEEIENDPTFLEKFLDLNIDTMTNGERAQRLILQIRYAAIRNSQVVQAALIQKVEAVRKKILSAVAGIDRKPNYFDGAFRTLLVEQARTTQDRHRLEKLFNFSLTDFAAKLDTGTKRTQFKNIKTTLSEQVHLAKITSLAQSVLRDMRTLRTQEEYQRAQIIKDLRAMKGWQQWRLGEEVKKLFSHAASSQSTICRIETHQKLVTPHIAEEFSRVFNIDAGLFMPHFFYE